MGQRRTTLLIIFFLMILAAASYLFSTQSPDTNRSLDVLSIPKKSVDTAFVETGIMIVDAREYPWSALGRLNIAGRHFCNAVAIGPDKVLAPASCLFNNVKETWFDNSEMRYVGAYQRDNTDLNAEISHFDVAEKYDPKDKTLAAISQDWALVTLSSPIGNKTGWLGVGEHKQDRQTLAVGYRRGWEHALAAYPYCSLENNGKVCPNARVDGLLNWFVLGKSQLLFSPPSGLDSLLENWDLSDVGQPPEETLVRPVPLDTISRLLKELGYFESMNLSKESLKLALEKAEQNDGVTQTDRVGIETLYQLIKKLRISKTATATNS